MDGNRTRVGPSGRVVIPAEYRKALGIEVGDEIVMRIEDGELRVIGRAQALLRAQARVRRYVEPGRLLSEELIAERRTEVERD